jgi:hypothetical protein
MRSVWMSVFKPVWKIPVVAVAIIVGAFGANQAGWSGAEAIVSAPFMGIEQFFASLLFTVGVLMTAGSVSLVWKIAKPALFVMAPILLYCAVLLGAWDGFVSDFDTTRLQVMKHQWANGYALEHMSARGRYLTCKDKQIQLTDDAEAVCTRILNVGPGETIPGSEHRCGFLGMSACVYTGKDKKSGQDWSQFEDAPQRGLGAELPEGATLDPVEEPRKNDPVEQARHFTKGGRARQDRFQLEPHP